MIHPYSNTDDVLLITTGGTIDAAPYPVRQESDGSIRVLAPGDAVNSELSSAAMYLSSHPKWGGHVTHLSPAIGKLNKDSKHFSADDLQRLAEIIKTSRHQKILVTMGTDWLSQNAAYIEEFLQESGKSVVFTGAFVPMRNDDPHAGLSDGARNLDTAMETLLAQESGVSIVIPRSLDQRHTAQIWQPGDKVKDMDAQCFVDMPKADDAQRDRTWRDAHAHALEKRDVSFTR